MDSFPEPKARNGNGEEVEPRLLVFPILRAISPMRFSIIGTGFYITRYGLFLTAKHVMEDLLNRKNGTFEESYALHTLSESEVTLRRVVRCTIINEYDIAVCEADNYSDTNPENPLSNMRPKMSHKVPEIDQRLITYGYPENKVLDFSDESSIPEIRADFYQGKMKRFVEKSEHPHIPYPHFETSVKIKSGASGGPIFSNGRIVAINCRGWEISDDNQDGDLSYVVPIWYLCNSSVGVLKLPENSWERRQISTPKENYSFRELSEYGHINLEL